MVHWAEFEAAMPDMAAAGRALLYQYGSGLAFLATTGRDGGPRMHPICPTLVDGHLYAAILSVSPKCADLTRDGRFALHTFPAKDVDDEFYVTGRALRADADGVEACERGLARDGVTSSDHTVFELHVDHALWSKYETRPQWPPTYTKWRVDQS
jgi:hypothetical protein